MCRKPASSPSATLALVSNVSLSNVLSQIRSRLLSASLRCTPPHRSVSSNFAPLRKYSRIFAKTKDARNYQGWVFSSGGPRFDPETAHQTFRPLARRPVCSDPSGSTFWFQLRARRRCPHGRASGFPVIARSTASVRSFTVRTPIDTTVTPTAVAADCAARSCGAPTGSGQSTAWRLSAGRTSRRS